MKEMITLLLEGSDDMLDPSMKTLIRKWSDPPKAIEVLEVLDHCVHGSLCTGIVMTVLNVIYEKACKDEGVTNEDVVKLAVWRK